MINVLLVRLGFDENVPLTEYNFNFYKFIAKEAYYKLSRNIPLYYYVGIFLIEVITFVTFFFCRNKNRLKLLSAARKTAGFHFIYVRLHALLKCRENHRNKNKQFEDFEDVKCRCQHDSFSK